MSIDYFRGLSVGRQDHVSVFQIPVPNKSARRRDRLINSQSFATTAAGEDAGLVESAVNRARARDVAPVAHVAAAFVESDVEILLFGDIGAQLLVAEDVVHRHHAPAGDAIRPRGMVVERNAVYRLDDHALDRAKDDPDAARTLDELDCVLYLARVFDPCGERRAEHRILGGFRKPLASADGFCHYQRISYWRNWRKK